MELVMLVIIMLLMTTNKTNLMNIKIPVFDRAKEIKNEININILNNMIKLYIVRNGINKIQ